MPMHDSSRLYTQAEYSKMLEELYTRRITSTLEHERFMNALGRLIAKHGLPVVEYANKYVGRYQ